MYRTTSLAVLVAVALGAYARAEKVNMTPEQLRTTATHVVTGNVSAIYERTESSSDWRTTHYVAEIRIGECEKGEGLKPGDLVYARYWQRAWIGKGQIPPSTIGHRGLPVTGESLRIYLACNAYDGFSAANKDGGYNVIGANGFEKVKPNAEK